VQAIDWLLHADPAIRWQALRDLTDAPADKVAAERARVATEGWGARLLSRRNEQGLWRVGKPDEESATLLALLMLRDMGLDPATDIARDVIAKVRQNETFHNQWAPWNGRPLFEGEVEPCINGRIVAAGAYFGVDVKGIVERLLTEQMADGGWNCEQENGSTRGSFHTTIDVLEGLLQYQQSGSESQSGNESPDVTDALRKGEEYLLERRLLRRLSTGEVIDPSFTQFSFPTGYHYDALRGLEYFRTADVKPDARMDDAIELVRSKRDADGRWALENPHDTHMVQTSVADLDFGMDEREGEPSYWNTLRAMRVLNWYQTGGPNL